jgi:hypothetical protein
MLLTKNWLECHEERHHYGDVGIDGRIPLNVSYRIDCKSFTFAGTGLE